MIDILGLDRARNRRQLKRMGRRAQRIIALAAEIEASCDEKALRERFAALRGRVESGESLESVLEQAFACTRVAAKRTLGLEHRPVQLIAGLVMHAGAVAELATGEGKTLSATLPLALGALAGPVHAITTNDYLARRDCEWMRPVYEALGLSVGALQHDSSAAERQALYGGDILYGTPAQFGFDYLRDHLALRPEQTVTRAGSFALVDEADSVLIDEARTPLIISGAPPADPDTYHRFAAIAERMEEGVHFESERKDQLVYPTEEGVAFVEQALGIEHLYHLEHTQLVNHLQQALRAKALYRRDIEYVVDDGEVKIVDVNTGRVMEGRRWSEGLHQAIEAKEGIDANAEQQVVAEITLQNLFRRYPRLAGMTGTAYGERKELSEVYGLDVTAVPPHRPRCRVDLPDRIYRTLEGKEKAVVAEVKRRYEKGQPVLLGTASVESSERISQKLTRAGVRHTVLNARQHAREAEIVAQAGRKGAVTVATNMAGRGVDILVDDEVRSLGGLCVIGSERHEARRIDDQLRGRSGRQGDPGESVFFLSAQDELIRTFAGDTLERLLGRIGPSDDSAPIALPMIARQIASAQQKVEERNAIDRKNMLKYDDILSEQREAVYAERRRVLQGEPIHEQVVAWLEQTATEAIAAHRLPYKAELEEALPLVQALAALYPCSLDAVQLAAAADDEDEIVRLVGADIERVFTAKAAYFGGIEQLQAAERQLFLRLLDSLWREQLTALEDVRTGIHLRAFAQRDPLGEYGREAAAAYGRMHDALRERLPGIVLRVKLAEKEEQEDAEAQPAGANG